MSKNTVETTKRSKEDRNKSLAEAVEKVKSGESSAYNMKSETGIPRTTIRNHKSGKVKSSQRGRPPLFSPDQEKLMIELVITLAGWGYPLEKDDFKEMARECAKTFNVTYKTSEWSPGEDWLYG